MALERLLWDNGKYIGEDGKPVKEKSLGRPCMVTVFDNELSSLKREKKAMSFWLEIFRKDDKKLENANAYCKGKICMSVYGGKVILGLQFYKI